MSKSVEELKTELINALLAERPEKKKIGDTIFVKKPGGFGGLNIEEVWTDEAIDFAAIKRQAEKTVNAALMHKWMSTFLYGTMYGTNKWVQDNPEAKLKYIAVIYSLRVFQTFSRQFHGAEFKQQGGNIQQFKIGDTVYFPVRETYHLDGRDLAGFVVPDFHGIEGYSRIEQLVAYAKTRIR